MMKKFGVNNTRAEKAGPTVKNGIKTEDDVFERIVLCSCGKKFAKTCPNKDACEISVFDCPYCGAKIK
jgi:hypothetical protein